MSAVATFSAKQFDRELIKPGEYPVRFTISGHVGDDKIPQVTTRGRLILSPDQTRSKKSSPKTNEVVAALLYQITESDREDICEMLADSLESDETCRNLADHLMQQLASSSISRIKGSLSFDAQ